MHGGVFIDAQSSSLPIDVKKIAEVSGVHLVRDSDAKILKKAYGRIYHNGQSWIIVYDDSLPCEMSRYIIAHELGHIFLQHQIIKKKYTSMGDNVFDEKTSERYADYFAERLLCPACVLWALKLDTPRKITELCLVEQEVAERRLKRLTELKKRGKFLTDPLEREVYEKFLPFIRSVKNNEYDF